MDRPISEISRADYIGVARNFHAMSNPFFEFARAYSLNYGDVLVFVDGMENQFAALGFYGEERIDAAIVRIWRTADFSTRTILCELMKLERKRRDAFVVTNLPYPSKNPIAKQTPYVQSISRLNCKREEPSRAATIAPYIPVICAITAGVLFMLELFEAANK